MIELWVVVVIGVGVCLFWWLKSSDDTNPLDKYQAEHISDFVAFAKTQRHLPKVEAIKQIRMQFRHLQLIEALAVYQLAIKDDENQQPKD